MRKLAVSALFFSASAFISRYLLPNDLLLIAAGVSLALSCAGMLFRGYGRKRILIAFISLAAGFVWCFAYTGIFVEPYYEMHEMTETLSAVVTDYPVQRQPRGYRADVSLRREGCPAAGARLYYYSEAELKPGDEIEFTAKYRRTDITDDGERYDALSSRGIFLSGYVSGDIVVRGDSGSGIRFFPRKAAQGIADKIGEMFPGDVSAFLKALLVGKRENLYDEAALTSALSASGIIHVVAISGMHISFLMGFLGLVIRNKRLFAVYAIPALILFMAMTGFTAAVTRAGIMQVSLICAPLFNRESDNITALSAAMLLILMINPYACASAGLQLSFAATLGIILFTSRINYAIAEFMHGKKIYKKKAPRAVINYLSSNLAATIGALIFTLPLMAGHFGYVSLVSPLANLLTIGVVSLVFPAGLLATALGFAHAAAGTAAAIPVTWAVRYIMAVAHLFSSVPYSVVYSSSVHVMYWLAYVYVMFLTLAILKTRLRQYLYPFCICLIMLFAVIIASLCLTPETASAVTVIDVGQGLSVAATASGRTVVIDCGSLSTNKAGEITHEFLQGAGCVFVDLLVITHFHDDHVNGVEFLLSRIDVGALAVPDPEGSFIAEDIIELARKSGTDIIYVTETLNITIGETAMFIYPPLGAGDENERGISVLLTGDVNALITGDMNSAVERSLLRFADLPKLDLLVAGHHGSRESSSQEILDALSPDIAVIPVGKNSFGHPHPETVERLLRSGAAVYRTDETGHVTVLGIRD